VEAEGVSGFGAQAPLIGQGALSLSLHGSSVPTPPSPTCGLFPYPADRNPVLAGTLWAAVVTTPPALGILGGCGVCAPGPPPPTRALAHFGRAAIGKSTKRPATVDRRLLCSLSSSLSSLHILVGCTPAPARAMSSLLARFEGLPRARRNPPAVGAHGGAYAPAWRQSSSMLIAASVVAAQDGWRRGPGAGRTAADSRMVNVFRGVGAYEAGQKKRS
jgi:hypothetical protein